MEEEMCDRGEKLTGERRDSKTRGEKGTEMER